MKRGTVYWRPTHVISSIDILKMVRMSFEIKLETSTLIFPNHMSTTTTATIQQAITTQEIKISLLQFCNICIFFSIVLSLSPTTVTCKVVECGLHCIAIIDRDDKS